VVRSCSGAPGHIGAEQTEVPRIVVAPRVKINLKSLTDPEIEDWSTSKFWQRINYSETFTTMQVYVAGEVDVYEYDGTGARRKLDLLTPEFKAECDARWPTERSVEAERGPTALGAPIAGKPRSKAAFDGRRPR
jgi:hypothetical protein